MAETKPRTRKTSPKRKVSATRSSSRRNGKSKVAEALGTPIEVANEPIGTPVMEEPIDIKPKRRRAKKIDLEVEAPTAEEAPSGVEEPSEPAAEPQPDVPDESLKEMFFKEFNALVERLRQIQPGYNPPPFAPEGLAAAVSQIAPEGMLDKVKKFVSEDMFDADTWKGMWYMLSSSVQMQAGVVQRRLTGEYDTDEWGLDQEYFEAVRPFFEFLYKTYWRVSLTGVENVPESGRALLVVNHSGQLPFDGAMVGTGIWLEHPATRLVRTLYATWFPTLPFVSDLLVKMGQVLATEDNGTRLLENDELVAVFPEGYKGVGKLYKDRYKLARFGRGGFIKMALRSKAPIIPVSVVGAEETYISLTKSEFMSKVTGMPYFPISPTFPWLGLLGFVPLPTKWYIDIGEPIPMDQYPAKSEQNLMLVSQLTDQVRNIVQNMILQRLAQRRSVFFG
ncbi:MAG: lysophospholipid acyltransferase family protein [Anaerolineae bacterium]